MEAEKLDGIKHRPARSYQWMLKNVSLTWKSQVVSAIWVNIFLFVHVMAKEKLALLEAK